MTNDNVTLMAVLLVIIFSASIGAGSILDIIIRRIELGKFSPAMRAEIKDSNICSGMIYLLGAFCLVIIYRKGVVSEIPLLNWIEGIALIPFLSVMLLQIILNRIDQGKKNLRIRIVFFRRIRSN